MVSIDDPAKERMAQALNDYLSALPAGTSAELIEALGKIVKTKDGILPPRVFFEAVEHSPVAISITDTNANIIYVNPAFESMTGYQQQELVGKNQSILSYKITPLKVYQNLWQQLLAGRHWNGVLVNKRKDGARYLADLTVAPVLGAQGQTCYYMALHRDVTDVNELERKVKNQKLLIESVVDAAPVVVVLLDINAKVLLNNQAYQKLNRKLAGQQAIQVFLAALHEVLKRDENGVFITDSDFMNVEVCYEVNNEYPARWFSCSGVWVDNTGLGADNYFSAQDEKNLLLVANEISAQKQQQEQVRANALRALMAEQQLLHSIRETLSGALFQLQGPLNVTAAALKMIERRGDRQNDSLYQALLEIEKTGDKVQSILRNSIPREQKEAVSSVNINEVIRDVLDISTAQMLKAGAIVDWRPSLVVPTILARQYGLRFLLKQLMDNAIKSLSEPGCSAREIMVVTKVSNNQLQLEVMDSGPGIAPEQIINVFEPFYSRWINVANSTGMGLAIAQDMASQHGGYLEIDLSYRQGCLIRLCLPLKAPEWLIKEADG